jgi:hypothetical protein
MANILEVYERYAQSLDRVLAMSNENLEEQPEWDAMADEYAAIHQEAAQLPAVASYLNALNETERSRLLALILDIQNKQEQIQHQIRSYRDQTALELRSLQNRDKLSDAYGHSQEEDDTL